MVYVDFPQVVVTGMSPALTGRLSGPSRFGKVPVQ